MISAVVLDYLSMGVVGLVVKLNYQVRNNRPNRPVRKERLSPHTRQQDGL